MGESVTPTTLAVRQFALPRLNRATRGFLAGASVTIVAGLLGAELMLGYHTDGHLLRSLALMGMMLASIGLAGLLGPAERPDKPLSPAERFALDQAFHGAPGSAVPIEGLVRVGH